MLLKYYLIYIDIIKLRHFLLVYSFLCLSFESIYVNQVIYLYLGDLFFSIIFQFHFNQSCNLTKVPNCCFSSYCVLFFALCTWHYILHFLHYILIWVTNCIGRNIETLSKTFFCGMQLLELCEILLYVFCQVFEKETIFLKCF